MKCVSGYLKAHSPVEIQAKKNKDWQDEKKTNCRRK